MLLLYIIQYTMNIVHYNSRVLYVHCPHVQISKQFSSDLHIVAVFVVLLCTAFALFIAVHWYSAIIVDRGTVFVQSSIALYWCICIVKWCLHWAEL